jgi:hypothetical protein
MTLLVALVVGLGTALHSASWGAFKDSPYEGFSSRSFTRSILVGLTLSLALLQAGVASGLPAVVLVGLCVAGERLLTEWWKAIVREDDQAAYSIPMRLGFHGRPVDSRSTRYAVGGAVLLALFAVGWLAVALQGVVATAPWWVVVIIGGAGGWLTAVGGAWKDAPIEGFSGWKFLRSPVVATAWALTLLPFADSWLVLAVTAAGWAVTSIETYKTFLTRGRPPGKFAGKPVRFAARGPRSACVLLHAGCHLALVGTVLAMLLTGDAGLRQADQVLSLTGILALALVLATLVLAMNRNWVTFDRRRGDLLVLSPPRSPMPHASLHRSSS